MKVVQINSTCGKGSTGKICVSISELLNKERIENYVLYSTGQSNYRNSIKFGSTFYQKIQAFKARVLGNNGFNAKLNTKRLLKELGRIKPDIVHIHNIHSNDVNFKLLFEYLQKKQIKTIYTFHDCWAFTGYCSYFTFSRCDQYIDGCKKCPDKKKYSWFVDKSRENQKQKIDAFSNLQLTIVTPSQWLCDIVKKSQLSKYYTIVINNGIDLNIFRPTKNMFREFHGISSEKYLILGVAYDWGFRKGLDVFIKLSTLLSNEYQIVLVGTNRKIDGKLPSNIISIHRTHNQTELADIYSAADLFLNPTREDNYPTVNMEAIACGTPVLTFKTGGSPEMLDSTCGVAIEDDYNLIKEEIERMCKNKAYFESNCLTRSKMFDQEERFKEYLNLYLKLQGNK